MPRGNDVGDAPTTEGGGINTEALIQQTQDARSDELERAQLTPVDEEATAALDVSKLSGPNGEEAVAAAVRGEYTVVVYVDARGGYSKWVPVEKKASKKAAKPAKVADSTSDDDE